MQLNGKFFGFTLLVLFFNFGKLHAIDGIYNPSIEAHPKPVDSDFPAQDPGRDFGDRNVPSFGSPLRSSPAPTVPNISEVIQTRRQELEKQQLEISNSLKAFQNSAGDQGVAMKWANDTELRTQQLENQLAIINVEYNRISKLAPVLPGPTPTEKIDFYLKSGLYGSAASELSKLWEQEHKTANEKALIQAHLDENGFLKVPEGKRLFPIQAMALSSDNLSWNQNLRSSVNLVNSAVLSMAQNSSPQAEALRQLARDTLGAIAIISQMAKNADQAVYQSLPRGVQISVQFLGGIADSAYDFAKGAVQLPGLILFHSWEVAGALGDALINYKDTYEKFVNFLKNRVKEFIEGDADKRAQMLGHLSFDIGALFVPVGLLGAPVLAAATKLQVYTAIVLDRAEPFLARAAGGYLKKTVMNLAGAAPQALDYLLRTPPETLKSILEFGARDALQSDFLGQMAKMASEEKLVARLSSEELEILALKARERSQRIETYLEDVSRRPLDGARVDALKQQGFFGNSKIIREFNPWIEAEPLSAVRFDAISTFRSGKYFLVELQPGEKLYRIGNGEGQFWTRVKPTSEILARTELALSKEFQNDFIIFEVAVPVRAFAFEGEVASQIGTQFARDKVGNILKTFDMSGFYIGRGNQLFLLKSMMSHPNFKPKLIFNPYP